MVVANKSVVQSRWWIMTLNNPQEEHKDITEVLSLMHKKTEAKYTVGQLEKGAEGTIHLQYLMNF